MAKAYWITFYRSVSNPAALTEYGKLAGPAIQAGGGRFLLGTALVATLDEWHQSFLPSRTSTIRDVLLDSAAGIAAQLAIFIIVQMQSFRRKKTMLPSRVL